MLSRMNGSTRLSENPWSYISYEGLAISSDQTLTLNPGVVLKSGARITCLGSLIAKGSLNSPIFITAQADDSIGSDVDGDGPHPPTIGAWRGIFVDWGGSLSLSNTEIRYAAGDQVGYFLGGSIHAVGNSVVNLDTVRLTRCQMGLHLQSLTGSPILKKVTIEANQFAVYADSCERLTLSGLIAKVGGIYAVSCNNSIIHSCLVLRSVVSIDSSLNAIVANNTILRGLDGISMKGSSAQIANNIIYQGQRGIVLDKSSTAILVRNLIFRMVSENYSGVEAGASDIHSDPGFVNFAANDYHLSASSVGIEAGIDGPMDGTWSDLDDHPRRIGEHVELGCYEYLIGESWLSADIKPEAYVGDRTGLAWQIDLRVPGGPAGTPVTVRTAVDGACAIGVFRANTYDVSFFRDGFLRKTLRSLLFQDGKGTSINVTLLNGDADSNNQIDSGDIDIVNRALGSRTGDANWDSRADVNGDGTVDRRDLAVVKRNLGKKGD